MNSDQFNPETLAPADATPADDASTSPTRRSRARRPRSAAPASAVSSETVGPEMTADVTSDTGATAASTPPSRRRRRATTSAREATPATDDMPFESVAPAPTPEIIQPLNAQDALVSEGLTGDAAAADAPLSRNRRRRGRGGRTAEPAGLVDVDLPLEAMAPPLALDPVEPTLLLDNGLAAATLLTDDDDADTDVADVAAQSGTSEGATASSRRRRRRRGGRGAGLDTADASVSESDDDDDVAAVGAAEPFLAASMDTNELEPSAPLSPAVRRRFDHMNWRERVGRGQGSAPAAPSPVDAVASTRLAAAPTSAVPGSTTPPSFERSGERSGRSRFGERQPYRGVSEVTTTPQTTAQAQGQETRAVQTTGLPVIDQPTPFTSAVTAQASAIPAASPVPAMASVSPIVTPSTADITPLPATSPTVGGGVEARLIERLERLLQAQSAALQQQGQAIQTLASTMTALQGAIERMATTGIAAGMPRAGMFVDAPNIIYAAENARVNIDYGRMLDFLGRGREMVHAIVYAPVTEDNGYRFDQQRFVAPFMNKGYKMVTKPLKRFPDGTAKGNFDIELAIDIVTMSQRLDVIILISGDSDFSRLVELIQSRGVRVEVVSFASNVSWELVQMADVFIDVGQYINEFRAL
jgi:uncharacterized LabA/DUF88 family protein